MKEAIGDLNMTVVVVVLVAALVAFFSIVVRPAVLTGIKTDTNCDDAICPCQDKANGVCNDCYICEYNKETNSKECHQENRFSCAYKG